jgi:uncharacterized membrane protein YdfJ with MMPL/SSD domain
VWQLCAQRERGATRAARAVRAVRAMGAVVVAVGAVVAGVYLSSHPPEIRRLDQNHGGKVVLSLVAYLVGGEVGGEERRGEEGR